MNMKRTILFIALIACVFVANAVVVQKIYTKNGSVLNGYIKYQKKNNIIISTESAIICVDGSKVMIENERAYNESSLSKKWIDWANKNDKFTISNGEKTLVLADIREIDGNHIGKVRILERGTTVKYLEMTPNQHSMEWSDITTVRGEKREKNALSGINRIYQTKTGQYEGEFAEETDSTLSLFIGDAIQTFKTVDVVKYLFKPINPNQDIFEQSPLVDIIRTVNGAEVKGIIVEQSYTSEKDSENYILVKLAYGAIQSIRLSEIAEIRKEENKAYNPLYDIILKENEIVVNRNKVKFLNTYVRSIKNVDYIIIDDSITNRNNSVDFVNTSKCDIKLKNDKGDYTEIVVEFNNVSSNNDKYKLLKANIYKPNKKELFHGFTYKDLVDTTIVPSTITTSVNNTTKMVYKVSGNGLFVIYDTKTKKVIPIYIEKEK